MLSQRVHDSKELELMEIGIRPANLRDSVLSHFPGFSLNYRIHGVHAELSYCILHGGARQR